MVTKGDQTTGSAPTIQYTDDELYTCALETYLINQCNPQ